MAGPSNMNFRRALLRIGQEMGQRDLDSLKFASRDAIPESRMEYIHSAKDVFMAMEEKGLLSPDKLDYITRLLVDIGRPQLLSHFEAFGFQVPDVVLTDDPVSVNPVDSQFTRCLLAISQKLTTEEVDRLAFAWCGTHLSIGPDKIFSAHQLFTLMSHKLILKPDNLQVLYIELNEMGRRDLCKVIEDYFQAVGTANNVRFFSPSPSPSPYYIREDSQFSSVSQEPYPSQHPYNSTRPTNLSFSSMSDLSSQMSQLHLPPQVSPPQNGSEPLFYPARKESNAERFPTAAHHAVCPDHYYVTTRPSSATSGSNDGSPGLHYNNGGEGTLESTQLLLQKKNALLAQKEEELQMLIHQIEQERAQKQQQPQSHEVLMLQEALKAKNKEVNEMREVLSQSSSTQCHSMVKIGDLYPMSKSPHGICLIINNYMFFQVDEHYEPLSNRTGAQKDQENLMETFKFLQYKVELHENLTSEKMVDTLKEVSCRDHSNYDSFVCCILTHGEEGQVFGSDSKPVNLQDLTGIMKATFTRSLIDKPKLFFVQACRGEKEDIGIPIEKDGNASLPVEADFLFGYATPTGKAAYRSRRHGSWFISELCQVLMQDSVQMPLGAMMKKVNKRVSDAYTKEGFKQCTEVVDRLRKDIVFFSTEKE